MVYLLDSVLPEEKLIHTALTYTYGINKSTSKLINKILGFSINLKYKELTNKQVNSIVSCVATLNLIFGNTLKKTKKLVDKNLIQIKSYRGLRKKNGLPVRGQRTHSNANTSKKTSVKLKKTTSVKKA